MLLVALLSGVAALAACSTASAPTLSQSRQTTAVSSPGGTAGGSTASGGGSSTPVRTDSPGTAPLPAPATLPPFPGTPTYAGEGTWHPAGRLVAGRAALYETMLVPPGGTARAGIAWMDTSLLSARLYSGSMSPGGGPYKYTAPVAAAAARSLVAAFNGGFKMGDARGGYYTEGLSLIHI